MGTYVTQTNGYGTRTHLLFEGKPLGTFACDGHADLAGRIAELLNADLDAPIGAGPGAREDVETIWGVVKLGGEA